MPIAGLTTTYQPTFLQCGTLRKGAAKNPTKPGEELPHWRFVPSQSDLGQLADAAFQAEYGPEPKKIRIYLPFDDLDSVFMAYCEAYTRGGLAHRCDGEYTYERDREGGLVRTSTPCPHLDWPRNREGRCKPVGRLQVIIDGLGLFAYATVLTTSIIDIARLTQQLQGIMALTGGRLSGIPLELVRIPEMISTPSGSSGQRARREKHMIHINVSAEYARAMFAATAARTALAGPMGRPALAPPAPSPAARVIDHDTGEIFDYAEPESMPEEYAGESAPAQTELINTEQEPLNIRMITKIRKLWEKEREACVARGQKYEALQAEIALDLEALPIAELERLGKKVAERLALYVAVAPKASA